MALDLNEFSEEQENAKIVSLEGDKSSSLRDWQRLNAIADRLIFLAKKPGLRPSMILQLYRLFKRLGVDVVHTHHIGPLLYAGIAARLAGVDCLIHTEHDAWHLNHPRRRWLQRVIIGLTRPLLVADAESVAIQMQRALKLDKVSIIRNGIDTERFTPGNRSIARRRLGLPLDVRLIGCSGRLETVKDHKTLIKALAQMPESVHLALAGAGSTEAELHALVNRLDLHKRVHFLGRIDEMTDFYRALDVFCLPSQNEGYPLSPLEAQSCNIPAVVTNVGGSRETLCPQSGVLVPAGEAGIMASKLHKMLLPRQPLFHPKPRGFIQKQGDVRLMVRAYANLKEGEI